MSRKFWCAALALALTGTFAACGDDGEEEGGGSSATTTAAATDPDETSETTEASGEVTGETPGVTNTEVHVTGFVTASAFGDAEAAARARFERSNAGGGVHGRQIVLDEALDDGGDPNLSLQQADDVVSRGETFAAVPVATASFNGPDAMSDDGMPFFGWAIRDTFCGPQSFSITGSLCADGDVGTDMIGILAEGLDDLEGQAVAILGQDDEAATRASEAYSSRWEELGAEVVFQENTVPQAPAVVSDFTPFATGVIDSGADIVLLPLSAANTVGMILKLQELGYDGQVINFVLYDPRAAALATDSWVIIPGFAPWEETGNDGIAQALEDLETYAPDTPHTIGALVGYFAADYFVSVLEATGPDLNRQSFADAVESFTYDFGGAAGPVAHPRTQSESSGCSAVVRGTGEGYEVVVPFTCADLVPTG